MKSETVQLELNSMFWLHLFVTLLAWVGPFLFWWPLMLIAYCLVQLQYKVFGKCLMNDGHDLAEVNDNTFYHYLLSKIGFQLEKKRVKFIVRKRLNLFLGFFTILWQVVLGFLPLVSFTYFISKLGLF